MDDEQLKRFAATVSDKRNKLRLTRSALAKAAGITRTTLRYLENGAQHPEQKTVEAIAKALGVTEFALTGHTPIEPGDPKFRDLNDDDLDIAQDFHHATLRVKHRVLGVLQERGRREPVTATVTDWARRLLALDPEDRQVIAQVIDAYERRARRSEPPSGAEPEASLNRAASEFADRILETAEEEERRAKEQKRTPRKGRRKK